MKAVHFGAGNIGRGFVGLILHNAGYEVVFADVAAPLIDLLSNTPSYLVNEVGANPRSWTVDGYRALNSRIAESSVITEIATADIVTTAVGPRALLFVAPLIAAAIRQRSDVLSPLTVMACENALNATSTLEAEVLALLGDLAIDGIRSRAVFANTAVDRIVPAQAPDAGLDVTVEDFFEWVIESGPFGENAPIIPEAHFVPDLAPYIERKLFTVNTGHATTAYHGFVRGAATLSDAIADPEVRREVEAVLTETSAVLTSEHGFDAETHQAYVSRALARFANPSLPDTPTRVGREPLRKLSRRERLVAPAVMAQDAGVPWAALVRTIGAALRFDVPEDAESVEMRALLESLTAAEFVTRIMEIEPGSDLFAAIEREVTGAQV